MRYLELFQTLALFCLLFNFDLKYSRIRYDIEIYPKPLEMSLALYETSAHKPLI